MRFTCFNPPISFILNTLSLNGSNILASVQNLSLCAVLIADNELEGVGKSVHCIVLYICFMHHSAVRRLNINKRNVCQNYRIWQIRTKTNIRPANNPKSIRSFASTSAVDESKHEKVP